MTRNESTESAGVARGLMSFADVEPVEPEWLWEGRVPLAEVTVPRSATSEAGLSN